ncbi:hypothetical protein FOA52_012790 [Chlamydomonas sp. UWO 241]|nr:hypothetical protein FOA52_012790 [Chlamydomonas sp. UWO 241]
MAKTGGAKRKPEPPSNAGGVSKKQQPASKPLVAAKPAKATPPAAAGKGKGKGAKAGGFSDENAKWLKPTPTATPTKQAAVTPKPSGSSKKKQAAPPPEPSDDGEEEEDEEEGSEGMMEGEEGLMMEGESDEEGGEEDEEGEDGDGEDEDEEMVGMMGDDFPSGEMDGSEGSDGGEGEEEGEESEEDEDDMTEAERRALALDRFKQKQARMSAKEAGQGDRPSAAGDGEQFQLPTADELELEQRGAPDLAAVQTRIKSIVQVMENFVTRREAGRSRGDYVAQLKRDLIL